MLDYNQICNEITESRKEISSNIYKRSFKYQIKEWFTEHKNILTLNGILYPFVDRNNYYYGDCALQYILYLIFNFIITACLVKLGFDYNIFPIMVFITLIINCFFIVYVFKFQACVTNLLFYFAALFLTSHQVRNAIEHDIYLETDKTEIGINTNEFFINKFKTF